MSERALRALIAAYVSLLVAPAGTLLAQPTPAVVVVGALAGLVVGTVLARESDPTDWLSGWRTLVFAALPAVWVPAALWMLPPAGGLPWIRLGGTTALVPAVLAVALANRRRTQRRLSEATTYASFTARSAPTVRRQRKIAISVVLFLSATISLGVNLVTGGAISVSDFVWLPALVPIWLTIFQDGENDEHEVAVTDAGLRIESGLHGWETFADYERTEETLRLARSDWYRWTPSFDMADIDDPDTVTAELSRHLSRTDDF
jgi:hypothetical protein